MTIGKCLIVTAHPLKASLNQSITRHVIEIWQAADCEIVLEDLYASNFQPVMTMDERSSYHVTSKDMMVSPEAERLIDANAVVLNFRHGGLAFQQFSGAGSTESGFLVSPMIGTVSQVRWSLAC